MAVCILSAERPLKTIPRNVRDRMVDIARDFSEVSGCWEWPNSRNVKSGYGQLTAFVDGKHKTYTAHRVSFATFNGDLVAGMVVCHTCDNRGCFNPAHLYQGTAEDNMRDMWERNPPDKSATAARGDRSGAHTHPERVQRGTAHHASKLTDDIVREIRASNLGCAALARRYGVTDGTISAVQRGITWTHVK